MNRGEEAGTRLPEGNLPASGVLARHRGTTYLAHRGKPFKFAQIRPDFVNYEMAALPRLALTTWAGRRRAE
jgi:hypothetical protein